MPKRLTFSEQLRRALRDCGMSRYRIAKEIGYSQTLLGLFVHGTRGLSLPMLDKLAALLGLDVVMRGPSPATMARAQRTKRRK